MSGSIGFYCLGWGLFLEEEGFNVGGFGFFRVDYLAKNLSIFMAMTFI